MTVLRDTFWDELAARMPASSGWIITDGSRYDPTVLNGLTPTGKVFSLTMDRTGHAVLTVAGRVRTRDLAPIALEDGAAVVTMLLEAWNSLPAGQR